MSCNQMSRIVREDDTIVGELFECQPGSTKAVIWSLLHEEISSTKRASCAARVSLGWFDVENRLAMPSTLAQRFHHVSPINCSTHFNSKGVFVLCALVPPETSTKKRQGHGPGVTWRTANLANDWPRLTVSFTLHEFVKYVEIHWNWRRAVLVWNCLQCLCIPSNSSQNLKGPKLRLIDYLVLPHIPKLY